MNIFDKFPYIVVEGPIGSGKSTLAKILADRFSVNFLSEKAEQNPFLPRFYEDMKRHALSTQLFFLFQRADQIQKIFQKDIFKESTVADFFLEKDPIFAKINLDDEEFKLYHQIFSHLQLKVPKPDLIIYIQTSIETLQNRIKERNIDYETNISSEYLEEVAESYSQFFHSYNHSPILILNNENLNILKDEHAIDLLVDRIIHIKSNREFFNPQLI
ncbi:MAG: deoxynucleoside kinase [Candidatus Methylopumilus sp.]|nr:deoxynucleoside kinase [Candidatus Methylopumilus sp.]